MTSRRPGVLLVGGHESGNGRCLPGLIGPGGPEACAPGRGLQAALRGRGRTVVVPMTLGRDPELAAFAAQTLRWAARDRARGDLLLAGPLGTMGHLVGWIRGAVTGALCGEAPGRAVLLVAPAAGPEPDAELFKVARLVRQHTAVRWVEVALTGGDPDVDEGVERCLRLGADGVVLVPASFIPAPSRAGAAATGPLLGPAALAALVRERVTDAEHRWSRYGDDGLAPTQHAHPAHPHTHTHTHGDDDHDHTEHRRGSAPPVTKEATAHAG